MSPAARAPGDPRSAVRLFFLSSPLVASSAWQPVAAALEDRGWSTTVATLPATVTTGADVQEAFAAALPRGEHVVLVPHSNAGLFVPWLAERHRVDASVFVDAAMPLSPGPVPLSPPGFYDFLAGLADESGLLPPWTEWWPASDPLVPDLRVREALSAQAPRLPLSYFRETVPVPDGWDRRPCAYLAFGDTYAEEVRFAESAGWPTRTLPGRHLHLLVDPEEVASAIVELLAALGLASDREP